MKRHTCNHPPGDPRPRGVPCPVGLCPWCWNQGRKVDRQRKRESVYQKGGK